jgi:tetrahydromethanopterin S-methyltransferase subunit G
MNLVRYRKALPLGERLRGREANTLDEIDKQILDAVYEMDFNKRPKIDENKFELGETDWKAKKQAFVYRIDKLERLKYIKVDRKSDSTFYAVGGRTNQKYNNAAVSIDYEKIHLSDKGGEMVVENRKTTLQKVSETTSKAGKVAGKAIGKWIVGIITAIVVGYILFRLTGK